MTGTGKVPADRARNGSTGRNSSTGRNGTGTAARTAAGSWWRRRLGARSGGGRQRRPLHRPALDTPLEYRPLLTTARVDPDTFGRFAEAFARFMGTARFLVYMTVFVLVWIAVNVIGLYGYRWDPYPFILLNLFFSTQASYAAPLILLAQNRQDDRERVIAERDRARDERSLADTEYLTREVAALRIALREVATRDFVRAQLRELISDLADELGERNGPDPAGAARGADAPVSDRDGRTAG